MKKPKVLELRKGRTSIANQIYLITTVTNKRIPAFFNLYAARLLVQAMHDNALDVDTLCYVIMPDHLHWLVQLEEGQSLSQLMQQVKTRSGFYIEQYFNLSEELWQAGYHEHALGKDEDIKAVARHVIANPLRAGLVDRIEDYSLWDSCWVQ